MQISGNAHRYANESWKPMTKSHSFMQMSKHKPAFMQIGGKDAPFTPGKQSNSNISIIKLLNTNLTISTLTSKPAYCFNGQLSFVLN